MKRGRKKTYPCPNENCFGSTIPVSKNMVRLAEQFYKMGYSVSKAEDFVSIVTENGIFKVLFINIEFDEAYTEQAFPDLPEGFTYHCYPMLEERSCRLVHHENYFTFGRLTNKQALKACVNRLYEWAEALEESGNAAILHLAGII